MKTGFRKKKSASTDALSSELAEKTLCKKSHHEKNLNKKTLDVVMWSLPCPPDENEPKNSNRIPDSVHSILQSLASFETWDAGCSNLNRLTSLRIAASAWQRALSQRKFRNQPEPPAHHLSRRPVTEPITASRARPAAALEMSARFSDSINKLGLIHSDSPS